jgi:hypothetical protein
MRPATVVYLISQLVLAAVLELSWLTEDRELIAGQAQRHISWAWLLSAQLLAIAAGAWEGLGSVLDRRRIAVYLAVPTGLVVSYMAQAFYWAPSVSSILVLVPSIGGTIILFSPSWAAVGVGILLHRRSKSGPTQRPSGRVAER